MKRLLIIVIGLLCCATAMRTQTVTNVVAKQVGNKVEITYDLDQPAQVTLLLSLDGGATYAPTPKTMIGDVGDNVQPGHNKIVWDLLADDTRHLKNARFKVIAEDILKKTFTVNGVSFSMIYVEGGTFTMGCTPDQGSDCNANENPSHQVTLSDYYIGQTEVTQGLWDAVMGDNSANYPKGDNYPISGVTWEDCQTFIEKLNSMLYSQLGDESFALPTEAQWEYAARGGKNSKGYKYSGSNTLRNVAWNADHSSTFVGTKSANELGVYDMSGNVGEWCQDWYGSYSSAAQINPIGPSYGSYRVFRGGCWGLDAKYFRVSSRSFIGPSHHLGNVGMRLVLRIADYKIQYFSEYAKPIVESAINEWQVKGEFEKTSDWQKRVNEKTRDAKIKELTKQCEANYLKKYTSTLKLNVSLAGFYDADNEVFLLSEPKFGDMIISVPIGEARAFKQNWASARLTPKYFIENDVLALSSLDIYFPSLKKHYTYSNQASLKYEQAQVDYNFAPIDIPAGGSSVQKGQQTIEQKKISIGKSQVDLQIPETNTSNPNTFVVIIANENYKSVASVPFALNDGRVLAKYCQRTLGIPAANIKVHENATYNDIRLAMAWLKNVCEKYEGEASVIFYYTGHGIPDESEKSAYLLPVDGDGRYVATGYKVDDLYQKFGEMPAKSITVLLDACFTGATRDGKMVTQAKGVALKVKKGTPLGNTVVLSAAQGDETAGFNEEEGHGMFTYFVLKKLQETKGNVNLQDLAQYVIREVGRKSAVTDKPQNPCVIPSATIGSEWKNWKLKP